MYWRRPAGSNEKTPTVGIGRSTVVYEVVNSDASVRKVGVGQATRLAHWEQARGSDRAWRVQQFVSLGSQRREAFDLEAYVKRVVCHRAQLTFEDVGRVGHTEAWPFEWGGLDLGAVKAGGDLRKVLSPQLRQSVERIGGRIPRGTVGAYDDWDDSDDDCECGRPGKHLHTADVVAFLGFTTQHQIARKYEAKFSVVRYSTQPTRGTRVTVLGRDRKSRRATVGQVWTEAQWLRESRLVVSEPRDSVLVHPGRLDRDGLPALAGRRVLLVGITGTRFEEPARELLRRRQALVAKQATPHVAAVIHQTDFNQHVKWMQAIGIPTLRADILFR